MSSCGTSSCGNAGSNSTPVPTTRPRCSRGWSTLGQRESLAQLVRELARHGEVDCPNCQHHFYLETDRIEELRHRLASLPLVEAPPLSVREIQKQLDFYDPEILGEWETLAGVVE